MKQNKKNQLAQNQYKFRNYDLVHKIYIQFKYIKPKEDTKQIIKLQDFYQFYSVNYLYQMRPKSFSKYGQQLQLQKRPANNQKILNKKFENLEQKIQDQLKKKDMVYFNSKIKKVVPTFQTIPRDKISPFILLHSRDNHNNLNYHPNFMPVQKQEPKFSIGKQKRISFFDQIANKQYPAESITASVQFKNTITNDFQNHRKKLHNFDFKKQPSRQSRYLRTQSSTKFTKQKDSQIRFNNFQRQSINNRQFAAHSFNSYPARQTLFVESDPKKILNPPMKNLNEVNFGILKKRWSSGSLVAFQKAVDKIKVRSDRDTVPWLTKLDYGLCKDKMMRSSSGSLRFELMSDRKMNEVHSKYALRICL